MQPQAAPVGKVSVPDSDHFLTLGEARRPWLEPQRLKQRFLELSQQYHPDRFHNAPAPERDSMQSRFTAINTAHQVLREPRDRLAHLLELETGSRPKDIQRMPSGAMDLFVEIGQACRAVDELLASRRQDASPLAKVGWIRDSREWVSKLGLLQQAVNHRQEAHTKTLQELNNSWEAADALTGAGRKSALPLEKLEEVYRGVSYAARWTAQIQQRVADLVAAAS
ncbi:MAG: hypothetical protein FJ405_17020 [Verrucomicrobia bacterium]|nr:hypothetical protein [Verrucomicrobiota bacterium]